MDMDGQRSREGEPESPIVFVDSVPYNWYTQTNHVNVVGGHSSIGG